MNSGSYKRVQNSIIKASFIPNIISVLTEIGSLWLLKLVWVELFIQDFVWSGSILLILLQMFKVRLSVSCFTKYLKPPTLQVWEMFLVRERSDSLYPVSSIEPVLTLTSLTLSTIYLHTCLRSGHGIFISLSMSSFWLRQCLCMGS